VCPALLLSGPTRLSIMTMSTSFVLGFYKEQSLLVL
jgi:hypothetical protein